MVKHRAASLSRNLMWVKETTDIQQIPYILHIKNYWAECSETYSCNEAVERLSLLCVLDCYWTKIVAKPDSWFDFSRSHHCVHLIYMHIHKGIQRISFVPENFWYETDSFNVILHTTITKPFLLFFSRIMCFVFITAKSISIMQAQMENGSYA